MSDGVAPCVQLMELRLANGVSSVVFTNLLPERETKSCEVGTDVPRIGIAAVQSPRESELVAQQPVQKRRRYRPEDAVNALRVEVAAEALKPVRESFRPSPGSTTRTPLRPHELLGLFVAHPLCRPLHQERRQLHRIDMHPLLADLRRHLL